MSTPFAMFALDPARWRVGELRQLIREVDPPRKDFVGMDGTPYLTRYLLAGELGSARPKVVLHEIHRSDADRDLHNHPWVSATSYILAGGYREFRREPVVHVDGPHDPYASYTIEERLCRPGDVNHIARDTFHRVELLDGPCWTLVVLDAKATPEGDWGFWLRDEDRVVPHGEYRSEWLKRVVPSKETP